MCSHLTKMSNAKWFTRFPSCWLFRVSNIDSHQSNLKILQDIRSGLSQKSFQKYLQPSTAIVKGHLAQTQQRMQSTKKNIVNSIEYSEKINQRQTDSSIDDSFKALEDNLLTSTTNGLFPRSNYPNLKTNEVQ